MGLDFYQCRSSSDECYRTRRSLIQAFDTAHDPKCKPPRGDVSTLLGLHGVMKRRLHGRLDWVAYRPVRRLSLTSLRELRLPTVQVAIVSRRWPVNRLLPSHRKHLPLKSSDAARNAPRQRRERMHGSLSLALGLTRFRGHLILGKETMMPKSHAPYPPEFNQQMIEAGACRAPA